MASDDIKTLLFPYSIRVRPGMFIGSTEDASNIFREVIDNVIDEMYRCKECDTLDIMMNDHIYVISDNGRGFPIKESTLLKGQTMAREATSNINSGSKFDNKVTSIGMNGSGIKCTNALSEFFILYSKMSLHNVKEMPEELRKSYKKEKYYYIKYEKGEFISEGFCNLNSDYSTIVQFKPDATIFESVDAYMPTELKYIEYILSHKFNKTMKVLFNGQPYRDELEKLHTEFTLGDGKYDILAGVSLKNKYENGTIDGSVNGLYCPNGLHIRWFTRAFVKAFNQMFYKDYSWDDVMYGLDVRVIMLYPEVSYTAQIKNCLASLKGYPSKGEQESDKLVEPILKVLKKEKSYWEIHNKRIQSLLEAKDKINTRDLVKDTFDVDNKKRKKLPSKLMDCTTRDRSKAELLLCEGSSAQSSLVQARDPKIHAVLALRGKMLNTVGKSIEEIVGNQEVNDIINAIGIGTRDYCKPKNIRYGKIIIAVDSDSDGLNIAALILGLLYTHIPKVIEMGLVYLSVQPLFKVGNQYIYQDTLQGINTKGQKVERYKGLGSVNPKDMKSMALDPKTRKLVKVTMKDAEYATQIMTSAAIKGEILIKNEVIVV